MNWSKASAIADNLIPGKGRYDRSRDRRVTILTRRIVTTHERKEVKRLRRWFRRAKDAFEDTNVYVTDAIEDGGDAFMVQAWLRIDKQGWER